MAENYFCPRCGNKFVKDTSFCRTCGLALDGVREIVSGDADNAPATVRRPNFAAFRLGIGLFILGLVIGLLNGALKDFDLFPQAYGKMIFLSFIAAGMLCFGAAVAFPTKKYAKPKKSASKAEIPVELKTSPLAGELATSTIEEINFPNDDREPLTAEPRSVTEHTTRNLN